MWYCCGLLQIELDIEELKKLQALATRPRVKDVLAGEIQKFMSHQQTSIASASSGNADSSVKMETESTGQVKPESTLPGHCISVTKAVPPRYYKEITTYGRQYTMAFDFSWFSLMRMSAKMFGMN